MPRKPRYSIQAMRTVVDYYRAQRVQPICPDCKYILFADMDDPTITPPGYEEMRRSSAYIQQCPAHDRPQYPWLHEVDRDKAAWWLVRKGNRTKSGVFTVESVLKEWREGVTQ